jgi:hypothetical protein
MKRERERLDRKILEELILDRLKRAVDLGALLDVEREVAMSIERALMPEGVDASFLEMARGYLLRAWRRAGKELAAMPSSWMGPNAWAEVAFWTDDPAEPKEPGPLEPAS